MFIDHLKKLGWFYVCPDKLTQNSIVNSFGIGNDISFDLELEQKIWCEVFGFDPTPKSISWCNSHRRRPQFHFYPHGIASKSGTVDFSLATHDENASGSLVEHRRVILNEKLTGTRKVIYRHLNTIKLYFEDGY